MPRVGKPKLVCSLSVEKLVSEQIAASGTQPGFRDPTWLPICDLTCAAVTHLRQHQALRYQRIIHLTHGCL